MHKDELMRQLEALHDDAYGWALACCRGDSERARDVLQDAYVKVIAGRVEFAGRAALKTWWFGIIRLTGLESGRRQRRWSACLQALRKAFRPATTPDAQVTAWDGITGCEPELLRNALKQLPLRQAEVLHLVFYEALSITESAAVMQVSVGSARRHYERGKERMRHELLSARKQIRFEHE